MSYIVWYVLIVSVLRAVIYLGIIGFGDVPMTVTRTHRDFAISVLICTTMAVVCAAVLFT